MLVIASHLLEVCFTVARYFVVMGFLPKLVGLRAYLLQTVDDLLNSRL